MKTILFLVLISLVGVHAQDQEKTESKPKSSLDYGVGLLYFNAPHYRGADQDKTWIIPSPYFRYVSEKMEVEPSYLRGTFYENDKIAFKLSLNAGLSADSEDNIARKGMPDLDWTLEAGPMFIWKVWETKNKSSLLTFEVPIRQVFATDFSKIRGIGIFMVPYINWAFRARPSNYHFHTEISFAYMHATKKYHSYFYEVPVKFSNPGRPTYEASSGNSGIHLTALTKKTFGKVTFTSFLRYDYLKKAAFADSPLVKSNSYFVYGLVTSYIF